jgi:hypothetical protein
MRSASKFVRVVSAAAMTLSLATVAFAQPVDSVTQVNKLYADISEARRSDLVLLPALAQTQAPPASIRGVHDARLMAPSRADWSGVVAWAIGAPQKAALKALADVTKEDDFRKAFGFAQPYGGDNVSPEMVRARLYTELGDPPTLAAAQFLHLPALDRLEVLANVEATRLASEGKPSDAIDVLLSIMHFGRQMADREMFDEALWGLRVIQRSAERLRDVAYEDMMGPRALDPARLRTQIARVNVETGYYNLDRIAFPQGNQIATDQVVARVYRERAGVIPEQFGKTMARLGSSSRPLRLFSESARWKTAAGAQADWFDTTEKARGIYSDWMRRWRLSWHDRAHVAKLVYSELDRTKFGAIAASTPDMAQLRVERHLALTELVGANTSLAMVGVTVERRKIQALLAAARPVFVKEFAGDPFYFERGGGPETFAAQPMAYFVPMRDTPKNEREGPQPYEMDIVTSWAGIASSSFAARLRDDTFVIYSVGSDNVRDVAKRVQNTAEIVQNADYLIFPPVLSLYRKHLTDKGELN